MGLSVKFILMGANESKDIIYSTSPLNLMHRFVLRQVISKYTFESIHEKIAKNLKLNCQNSVLQWIKLFCRNGF